MIYLPHAALNHIGMSGMSDTGVILVSGQDLTYTEARTLLIQIIETEIDNWVPNSSQQLIARAGQVLGMRTFTVREMDHGIEPTWHQLVTFPVFGRSYLRCEDCCHLYRRER